MKWFWNFLCKSVVRSADTMHCRRTGQYYNIMIIVIILNNVWELICNPSLFLFMEEVEISRWWDLWDLFFIIDLFRSSGIFYFLFWNTHKDKSKSSALFLNVFLHLFLFYSFYCPSITSLTKTEMNGIPFWKGMRNRCKHVCIRQGILWNLLNWKSRFRKIFDAGSVLNCYQRHCRITVHPATRISK